MSTRSELVSTRSELVSTRSAGGHTLSWWPHAQLVSQHNRTSIFQHPIQPSNACRLWWRLEHLPACLHDHKSNGRATWKSPDQPSRARVAPAFGCNTTQPSACACIHCAPKGAKTCHATRITTRCASEAGRDEAVPKKGSWCSWTLLNPARSP